MRSQVTLTLVILALGIVQAADKVEFAGTWKQKNKPEEFCGFKGDKIYTTVAEKNLNLELTFNSNCAGDLANLKLIATGALPEDGGNTVSYKTDIGTFTFIVIGDAATLKAPAPLDVLTFSFERSGGFSIIIIIVLILAAVGVGGFIFVQKRKNK